MNYGTVTPHDLALFESGGRLSRKVPAQSLLGPICLIFTMMAGASFLYARLAGPSIKEVPAISFAVMPPLRSVTSTATPVTVTPVTVTEDAIPTNTYGALFDPRYTADFSPSVLADNLPLGGDFQSMSAAPSITITEPDLVPAAPEPANSESAENIPAPLPRPPELGLPTTHGQPAVSARQNVQQQSKATAVAAAPADNRSFFEKIFGAAQPSGQVLAYATPEDGAVRPAPSMAAKPVASGYDRWTAVYDISARVVYMPDGRRLEAHSGLGDRLDDPRYVSERMRGPTPPHVYDLTLREQLFHGVQALRLNPVGEGDLFGRTGLLAHRYMLGPNGDSNGCVSFKDYNAFLQAYLNGEVKRLVVVARL